MTTILTGAALAAATLLAAALWITRSRLRALEARTARLEEHVRAAVEPEVAAARAEARDATVAAHRGALASGVAESPPRLPFEPVTGRVVRAVAFGAGARRALARAAVPGWSRRGMRKSA